MFKNIFPGKLNRFVYVGGPEAHEASEAIRSAEAAKVTPEQLRSEAAQRAKAIDDFLSSWEISLNTGQGSSLKLDRNNPSKLDSRLRGRDREIYSGLLKARDEFIALSRKSNVTRQDVDRVKVHTELAMKPYELRRKMNDPLYQFEMQRVADAKPIPKSKAQQASERKESTEVARWTKMSRLVEEYIALGKTPADKTRKAEIQDILVAEAGKVMTGRQMVARRGNLTITKAAGAGTPAYMFDIDMTRGLKGSAATKYRERMFAGGSAKDFPNAKPIV